MERHVLKRTSRPVPKLQEMHGGRTIRQLHQGRGMPSGKFLSTIGLLHTFANFLRGKIRQEISENPLCTVEVCAVLHPLQHGGIVLRQAFGHKKAPILADSLRNGLRRGDMLGAIPCALIVHVVSSFCFPPSQSAFESLKQTRERLKIFNRAFVAVLFYNRNVQLSKRSEKTVCIVKKNCLDE